MNRDFEWLKWVGLSVVVSILVAVYFVKNDKNIELNADTVYLGEKFVKVNSSDSSNAAQINYDQLVDVTHKTIPKIDQYKKNAEGVTQFLPLSMSPNFTPYKTWMSIKITAPTNTTSSWGSFLVEAYDAQSYEESKFMAFQACKEVWKNIDNRVPLVIDELSQKINNYEKQNSKAATRQIRYGYWVNLDASHYAEGYPIVCQIAVSK